MLIEHTEQPFLDLPFDSPLEQLSATAMRYLIALGPQAERATLRVHDPSAVDDSPTPTKPFTVARDGFSVNCAVACEAHDRAKLERVCRYRARPPLAEQRLSLDADGLVVYALKHAFRDATTHVLFEPIDFIARLAALVPRPRAHLIRYHALCASNARHRHLIVPRPTVNPRPHPADQSASVPTAPMSWMARLNRVFGIDIESCPRCGGQLRVIATVTEPTAIAQILAHLHRREPATCEPRGPLLHLLA